MTTSHKMVCTYGFNNLSLEEYLERFLVLTTYHPCLWGRKTKCKYLTLAKLGLAFKEVMEDVCRDHEPTVITRQRGNPVVVMSLDDFNGMKETIYLLSSKKNANRLLESVARIKAGQTTKRNLINDCQTEAT